jgi:hypothetical protein
MTRPLTDLRLDRIQVFLTRAAYKAVTGNDAAPFNPSKPIKNWIDTQPPKIGRFASYQSVALNPDTGGTLLDTDSKKPFLETFTIPIADVATVNMLPDDGSVSAWGFPNNRIPEWPLPMRQLNFANGEFWQEKFMGGWMWNDGIGNPTGLAAMTDRQLLEAIYTKLNS